MKILHSEPGKNFLCCEACGKPILRGKLTPEAISKGATHQYLD